mgnify:CR=1 FL=1
MPAADENNSIEVKDGRKRQFGVVYRNHIDRDDFRALSPSTRLVYFALLTFVGRADQQAWPKVSRLARMVGASERTVWRAVKSLESAGYLTIGKKWYNRARRVNLYTLTDPDE